MPIPGPSPVKVTREQREQALAAMLEGQRHAWGNVRTRSQAVIANNTRLARVAYQRALDLDPTLAEAYTAMSELAISTPPNDIEMAIELAKKATSIDKNNFGAHRIIARLNTFKSRLNYGTFDKEFAERALSSWKEITRLDSRNAEGWAFQAALYDELKMPDERIKALRKWLASTQPIESGFYRQVMGSTENLAPEAASMKLGSALIEAKQMAEAVEVLSGVVAETPEDALAVVLLERALDVEDTPVSLTAIQSLQQAAYANSSNVSLYKLIAQMQMRNGRLNDAVATLTRSSLALELSDKAGSASLQVTLGDIYAKADRTADAIDAFEKALEIRKIGKSTYITLEDREFAVLVFGKIIQTYRIANRTADVTATISRARKLLGQHDLFSS